MNQYYDILGVSPGVSAEDLKKAYRKKAFETHPDRNNGDDTEFKKVGEAYDKLTKQPQNPSFNQGPFGGDFDFWEMFRDMRQHREKYYTDAPPRPPQKDEDITVNMGLKLSEIKSGKVGKISVKKSKDCDDCCGVGGINKKTCLNCGGQGKVAQQHQQNNFFFRNIVPCSPCMGRGHTFDEICSKCKSLGWTEYQEDVIFEVKVK